MNRQVPIYGLLVLLICVTSQFGSSQQFRPLSKGNPTTVENFVEEMFFITKTSGSLTLSGTCKATEVEKDIVPDALSQPPQGPFNDLGEAITAISRSNPHLTWVREASGLLRVRDDRVSNDVLRIRLQRVHFRNDANANDAIVDALSAPEVQAYFKMNRIEDSAMPIGLIPTSTKGSPRLSGEVRDLTLGEALDYIMHYFPGLWIYSECQHDSLRRIMVRGVSVGFPRRASVDMQKVKAKP
jgi:hypothetical protein